MRWGERFRTKPTERTLSNNGVIVAALRCELASAQRQLVRVGRGDDICPATSVRLHLNAAASLIDQLEA